MTATLALQITRRRKSPISSISSPGCLIAGGLVLAPKKCNKMDPAEGIGVFALYTILTALFTNPVIDAMKNIVT